ncbi:MAG: restriction endonuclease subunit S [Alistipes sp.]|nr:restriction endonuclease subunit S [Alistipes sp.]
MPAFDNGKQPTLSLGEEMHSNRTIIRDTVLLFNKLNVRQQRVWFVESPSVDSVCSMEFLPYVSKSISLEFLYHYLKTDVVTDYFNGISKGTSNSQKRITPQDFLDYKVILPPIAEQRAIAEALSDVDGLIAALDKKIAKKRLLKQGAMQQLLTGKKRLPGFTDEWVDTPIGEGVRFQVGYPFQSQYFTSDRIGKRLVKNRDLKSNDQIVFYNGEYEHKFIVHNGDILIGMDGDFLPYKWDKGIALLNQRVGRLLPTKKWDLSFVMYALIEPLQKLQDGTGATTVKHLSHNDIEQMVLCIPQNYEEQQAIATILSDMDKVIADLEAQRDKYRLLKSGMMQKLLTGQIRLKNE